MCCWNSQIHALEGGQRSDGGAQGRHDRNARRPSLYREVTTLLINSLDPGLLPDYKDLPEPVRKRPIRICLGALYSLPHAIEEILRRVSENFEDHKVRRGFASVFRSVESFYMAHRILETKKLKQRPKFQWVIAARCMATVIVSRLSIPDLDPETRSTLFEFLGIPGSTTSV